MWMRLPCTPLISKGWTALPSSTNDNRSDTSVFGCGATAIWNSNVVGAVISISSSAPTARFIALVRIGSAAAASRCAASAPVGRRPVFSDCTALGIPCRLCRSQFPLFHPAPGDRMRCILDLRRGRAAAGAEPPMSAWLPITRGLVMCVISISPSAHRDELLIFEVVFRVAHWGPSNGSTHGSHCGAVEKRRACWKVEITAIVASAPWLGFTPSARRPSNPPPVSGSHISCPASLAP